MDWGSFFSAFGLVFVAELGDKTQLAVFTQTCRHRRPWSVFAGASAALVLVTALGVIGGQVLGRFVPVGMLRVAAGAAFVAMGLLVGREAARGSMLSLDQCPRKEGCEDLPAEESVDGSCPAWDWRVFGVAFGLLFLAELGDKTQLAVFTLSSNRGAPWAVLGGGALALTGVTAVGVLGGRLLCDIVPRRVLLWISAGAFLLMGVLVSAGVL